MTAPTVAPYTRRLWEDLPELYRAADETQADGPNGFPLERYISLIGDQAGEVETLLDRLALHEVDGVWVSDLADPDLADDGWLVWMAQFAGIQADLGSSLAESYSQLLIDYPTYTALQADNTNYAQLRQHGSEVGAGVGPDQLRQALRDSALGRLEASTGSWERIIKPYLTGAQRVLQFPVYGGDPWHLQIETYDIETPDPVVVAAVIARTEHAAGLVVTYAHRTGASYAELLADTADFPTYTTVKTHFATYADLASWIP